MVEPSVEGGNAAASAADSTNANDNREIPTRHSKASGKRRRSEASTNCPGNNDSDDNDNETAAQDAATAVETPAAKRQARRGLYGRVSGIFGRAVGLLTPGRARTPAALVLSPHSALQGSEDNDEVEGANGSGSREGDNSARLNNLETGAGRRVGISALDNGSDDEGFVLANGGEGALWEGAARRVTVGGATAGSSSPGNSAAARASLRNVDPAAVPPPVLKEAAVFSPGVRGESLKDRARARGATAAAARGNSPLARRASGHGLGFTQLRGSMAGDEDGSPGSYPPAASGGFRRSQDERASIAGGEAMLYSSINNSSLLDCPLPAAGRTWGDGHEDENGNEGEEEEEDAPFTCTELRDLVRALTFKRGLPPAAAMYLLSKMESPLADLVRRQILQEHQKAVTGSVRGSRRHSVAGGRYVGPDTQHHYRHGSGSRSSALVEPVARWKLPPPGANVAPFAPLQPALMMPPPPPRGGLYFDDTSAASDGSGRLGMLGDMQPPPVRGKDPDDLLTPGRRRERSFAIATPGGARVWKTASASNQGTPWAARSQQQRSQPGVRTLVVAESPRRQSSSTLGQHRPGEESNGAPRTPAAMARRIISVLNDASSPRSPVQLSLPEPSPAPNALTLRSRRYDEEGPLPSKTLSVPHPAGGGSSGGGSAGGFAAPVTPARLPPSRWARRSDAAQREEMGRRVSSVGRPLRNTTAGEKTPSDTTPPRSRKRKNSDLEGVAEGSMSEGKEPAALSATLTMMDTSSGAGAKGLAKEHDDTAGTVGGRGRAGSSFDDDLFDELSSATAPPRTKRARTSSESYAPPSGGDGHGHENTVGDKTEPSRITHNGDDSRERNRKNPSFPSTTLDGRGAIINSRTTRSASARASTDEAKSLERPNAGKAKRANGGNRDTTAESVEIVGGEAPENSVGVSPPATPGRQRDSGLTEEERRLEARRRGRQARSPYVYGGGRVDPNAGLPKSIRPPARSGISAGEGSVGGGGGESASFAVPARTPTKYWTCRGCYVRNYSMDATTCDMCRVARNYGTPQHKNPMAILPGGRTLYANRAGLEAAGLASPGGVVIGAKGKSGGEGMVSAAASGRLGNPLSDAATTQAGSISKPRVTFQDEGSTTATAPSTSSVPAPKTAPLFSFTAERASATPPAAIPALALGASATAPATTVPAPAAPAPKFMFGMKATSSDASTAPPVSTSTPSSTATAGPVSSSTAASSTATTTQAETVPVPTLSATLGITAATPATVTKAVAPVVTNIPTPTPAPATSAIPSFIFGAPSTIPSVAAPAPGPTAEFVFGGAASSSSSGATPAGSQASGATPSVFTFGSKITTASAVGASSSTPAAGSVTAQEKGALPTKTPLFGAAPATTLSPVAPVFSFTAGAPAPAATATASAAGLATPTPSSFSGFGGGGGFAGVTGRAGDKRSASPGVGGFNVVTQGPPKRGPSPAVSVFGAGGGFGGADLNAAVTTPAPGGAAFSFGQKQPAGSAGGMFGAAPGAPSQAPAYAFPFGATVPGVAPGPTTGGFNTAPTPGQFRGAVAPPVGTSAALGVASGGFSAGIPGAPAPVAAGFSLGSGAQPNPKVGRRMVRAVRRPKQRR